MEFVFHTAAGLIHLAQIEQEQRGVAVQELQRHAVFLFGGKILHRAFAEGPRQSAFLQAYGDDVLLGEDDAERQRGIHKAAALLGLDGGRIHQHEHMAVLKIDALVVIGGDGSFTGAKLLIQEHDIPVVGIPGTIDNDLYGTDSTIGYDTAVNTAVEAVDKIKDTASAHNRLFFVEVMGRDAGFIALRTAIATGAEAVLVPEVETDLTDLEHFIEKDYNPKTSSGIVIVAEGEKSGGAYSIAEKVAQKHPEYDIRVSVLGHMQRGGSPSQFDRVLASQLGAAAVDALMDDQKSIMLGIMNKEIVHVPFNKTIKHTKNLNPELLNLVRILSI